MQVKERWGEDVSTWVPPVSYLAFLVMSSNIFLFGVNTHYETCCKFPNSCDIWFKFVLSADKESTYP